MAADRLTAARLLNHLFGQDAAELVHAPFGQWRSVRVGP
jgi:hypothetical protein